MNALIALKYFIPRAKVHKVLTIMLHTMQMTQVMRLRETKPKTIFDIDCDNLA